MEDLPSNSLFSIPLRNRPRIAGKDLNLGLQYPLSGVETLQKPKKHHVADGLNSANPFAVAWGCYESEAQAAGLSRSPITAGCSQLPWWIFAKQQILLVFNAG